MKIFFDIETIPTQDPREMSEIESCAEEYDMSYRSTALNGAKGEVFCISAQLYGRSVSFCRQDLTPESESSILRDFGNWLVDLPRIEPIHLIGHNSIGFDRPFLRQRSIARGIRMPRFLIDPIKPWEATHVDTMLMFSGDPQKRVSLDRLARILNLGSKEGTQSKNVWDAVKAGDYAGVQARCEQDVNLTAQIWRAMSETLGVSL